MPPGVGDVGSGDKGGIDLVPGNCTWTGGISVLVAAARPSRFFATSRIVIPDESSAIFGPLITACAPTDGREEEE